MTDELPELRRSHPFVMYEMLKDTPRGVRATLEKMETFDYSALNGPLWLTGNGTAYHSAVIGSQILERGSAGAQVVQAYELEKFRRSSGTVVGLSHTGKTKSTIDALREASNYSGTVGITHYPSSPITEVCDSSIVIGNFPDKSLCNTKAFFDNVFSVLALSSNYGDLNLDLKALELKVQEAIETMDTPIMQISEKLGGLRDIFVLGAGPNLFVAREAAQKLKESTHLHAEGIELEEFNHGCTSVIDENTLVVIIDNDTVRERANDIVEASRAVGTRTLVINGKGDYSVKSPLIGDELLDPVLNTVPLYYLSYHLAVSYGINPDYLRFEDERYLKYDNVVFPPGAH